MEEFFATGSVWRHKKKSLYAIVGVAQGCDSSNLGLEGQAIVVYRSLAEGNLYCRPKEEFLDGRFTPIKDDVGTRKVASKALPKGVRK